MPTPAVSPNSAASALQNASRLGAAATTASNPNDSLGKDTFLKLLVAQLKFQDPLKPTDAQSFLSQTAQFTQVEKLEDLTKELAKGTQVTALSTASALLGRTVTFGLPEGGTATGVVTSASPATDGVKLKVGSRETTLDQLIEVRAAATSNGQ